MKAVCPAAFSTDASGNQEEEEEEEPAVVTATFKLALTAYSTAIEATLKATLAAALTTAGAEGITAEDLTVTGKSFEVSSTIEFQTYEASYDTAVEAALLKDLGVASFTSFAVTAARRRLLAGATAGPRRN